MRRRQHDVMDDGSDPGWEFALIEIFGQQATTGLTFPKSRVKKTIVVTADGKGGRTKCPMKKPIPTVSDVIVAIVKTGAMSIADVRSQFERLRRKGLVQARWQRDCEQIAAALLGKGRRR